MDKINSFDEANLALLEIARCQSSIDKEEANMNNKINNIKEQFELITKDTRNKKDLLMQSVEDFCKLNKKEFEEKERTKKLKFGEIGFRTNPPKIVQLSKKFSTASSLELVKSIFKRSKELRERYVRTKTEINKDALLEDYNNKKITDEKLAACGLRRDQDETFVLNINWEAIEESKVKKIA